MDAVFFQQILNGLSWGAIYALIALGYTMVYGILRLVNFAHGEVYMIGAMSGFYLSKLFLTGTDETAVWILPVILVSTMTICGLLGVLIERLAYRPLRKASKVSVLITAVGVSLFLKSAAEKFFGVEQKMVFILDHRPMLEAGNVQVSNIQGLIFSVALFLMVGLHLLVKKTRQGKAMRAIAFSTTASHFVGIPVNRIIMITFLIGSALAGTAGVLVSLYNRAVNPLIGEMLGLKAFVAAVLGGIGSLSGAFIGGLLMGVLESLVKGYVSSSLSEALAFVLLIFILLLKPEGLMGKRIQEKV